VSPRRPAPHRHPVWLRRRIVRRLHGAPGWHGRPRVPDAPEGAQQQEGRHHRGPQPERHAPGAGRLGKTQCRAVRLLSDRPDHAGSVVALAHAEPDRCADRYRDAGQHLPLWHLSAHSRRDQDRGREARMTVINVSRRQFLGGMFTTGAFVLASRVLPESAWAQTPAPIFKTKADLASLNPSVYLGIEPDGTVFIVTHRSEMGTGIRTTLPMVAADELDADWGRCRIEQGVGDPRYGDQNTDGSRSVRDFYEAFRRAGASARTMLVSAAAAQWNVPAAQCVVRNHEVIHEASNRRVGFGALVPAAAKLSVPKAEDLRFKPKTAGKLGGEQTSTYDQKDIVTGKAQFGL